MYKIFKSQITEQTISIVRSNTDGSVTSFAIDLANTDYQTFKKDLANGAELQDADGNVIDGIAYLEGLA
jgi:hypothetical protein